MKKLRRWLHQVWKAGRNPILEDICANLRLWGIDSDVSPTSRWEPVTHNTESRAIGMVTIRRGPVKWVNYRTESITDGENAGLSVALLDFGIPDSRLRQQSRTGSSYFYIESIKVRKIPWVGRVIEFSWKGNELGLGIVDRLSSDEEVNSSLMTGFASWGDVQIRAFKGLWTISMLDTGIELKQQWRCYQAIARQLLDTPDSILSAQLDTAWNLQTCYVSQA